MKHTILNNLTELVDLLYKKSKIIEKQGEEPYKKQVEIFSKKDVDFYLDDFKVDHVEDVQSKLVEFVVYDSKVLNLIKKHFNMNTFKKLNTHKIDKLILFLFLLDKEIIVFEKDKITVKECEIENVFENGELYAKFF